MKKKHDGLAILLYTIMLIGLLLILCELCGLHIFTQKKQPESHGPTETVRIEVRPGHYIDFPKVR